MTLDLTIIAAFRASDSTRSYLNSLSKLASYDNVEVVCVTDDVGVFALMGVNANKFVIAQDNGAGVYNAFNIGLSRASGRYYSFYNAGDQIEIDNLPKVLSVLKGETSDLLFFSGYYGSNISSERYQYLITERKLESRVLYSMPNVHGAIFFKTSSCSVHKFNLKYKTAADLFQLNMIFRSEKCVYRIIDIDWYTLVSGGVSSKILMPSLEKFEIHKELRVNPVKSVLIILRSIIIKIITKVMGDSWYAFRRLFP